MENKESVKEYLPLGSIVVIQGSVKKIMIIARGLKVRIGDHFEFFDYGGCLYPEGLMGEQVMYFQHENIQKVVFEGYADEDNEIMLSNIETALENDPVKRADVKAIKNS